MEEEETSVEPVKKTGEVGKVMTETEYEEWKKEKEKKPDEEDDTACSWGFGNLFTRNSNNLLLPKSNKASHE